jgi:KAP family P-loop domain
VASSAQHDPKQDKDSAKNLSEALPISIHPNPDYYVETSSSPYLRVRQVIDISDGGVLGITGERGAGKSVLLNKLVDSYSKDFLTVNLSAPISSSREMEFFLMLFRHLTQRVIAELKVRLKAGSDDINVIGYDALRKQNWFYILRLFAVSLVLMIGAWSVYGWRINKVRIGNAQTLLTQAAPTRTPTSTPAPESSSATPYRSVPTRTLPTKDDLDKLEKETWPWLGELGQSGQLILWSSLLMVGALLLIPLQLWRPRRRLPPPEMGLLIYSERLSRKLDYELTTKGEWGAEFTPLKWLKLSNKKGTEEKVRPLSLPELTADYIEFVSNVLRVFPGKLLICIDELDKVTDLDQVRFILREIKGALYAKGTFYMLSISNDALRSFEGRLGDQRDIFESTFDDVFAVRSLDLESSVSILSNRLKSLAVGRKGHFSDGALIVISVFSAGNARDLIRGFRECAISAGTSERNPSQTWTLLFRRRAESILDRVVATKGFDEPRSQMIGLVEELIDDQLSDAISRVQGSRGLLRNAQETLVIPRIDRLSKEQITLNRLLRYCTELEILLYAKQRVADQPVSDGMKKDASMIMKAYQLLPFSQTDSQRILTAIDQGIAEPSVRHRDSSVKSMLQVPVADRKTDKPTAL